MTETYSSQFGGDLVSEALSDSSLSWGIWQDPPKFHDGQSNVAYVIDHYEDEDDNQCDVNHIKIPCKNPHILLELY